LNVTRVACQACGLTYEGAFQAPRLARLDGNNQHLIELVVLAAGNLKEVAAELEISYPTLRKRLEAVIDELRGLQRQDDATCQSLLDDVEAGRMAPEEASRLIKELQGGA
jgi:hypothetical protein